MYSISYKIETCEESFTYADFASSWQDLVKTISLENAKGYKDKDLIIRSQPRFMIRGENKLMAEVSGLIATECRECYGEGCEDCSESGYMLSDIEHVTIEIKKDQSSHIDEKEMLFLQNFLNSAR